MKRISSSVQTKFLKWGVPVIVVLVCSIFFAAGIAERGGPAFSPMFTYVFPAGMLLFAFVIVLPGYAWDLADEVHDGGDYLVVRKGRIEDRIALSDIMNVNASNRPRVTLQLVKPGRLGRQIAFAADEQMSPPGRTLAVDLMIRIHAARAKVFREHDPGPASDRPIPHRAGEAHPAMKRISSGGTFYMKKVEPVLVFAVSAIALYSDFNKPPRGSTTVFVVELLAIAFLCLLLWPMLSADFADEVYDGGDYLLVKRRGVQQHIALGDIINVQPRMTSKPPRITLRLAKWSEFGMEVVFVPAGPLFPGGRIPYDVIATDLIARVDAARVTRLQSEAPLHPAG